MQWKVFHLKPRREKKMAGFCNVHGVEYYLPLREETRIYQRRKVVTSKPVFPSYFFARFDDKDKSLFFETDYVCRILLPKNESLFLTQVEQIKMALSVDPTLNACDAIKKGRSVRIKAGPFEGMEGIVSNIGKNNKVYLNIDIINQAIKVETEREFLELID